MSVFKQINMLQRVTEELITNEREMTRTAYNSVMKELLHEVEEFGERETFDKWIQTECSIQNTHKDRIEREFWSMGGQNNKWRCVEKTTNDDVFCYSDGGIRCVQSSKMQVVLCY